MPRQISRQNPPSSSPIHPTVQYPWHNTAVYHPLIGFRRFSIDLLHPSVSLDMILGPSGQGTSANPESSSLSSTSSGNQGDAHQVPTAATEAADGNHGPGLAQSQLLIATPAAAAMPAVAGIVYQAPAVIIANATHPPLIGREIDMNPVFSPPPHPHTLALHFHGAPENQTYYVVSRGNRCGIYRSCSLAEGYTQGIPHNMRRARRSFSAALEEYSTAWNSGLVREI
ncbi:hypothetical protein C8J56DRAFT_1057285 [Mycena floridula]|nr:hypothetical protein C8J56DRAFT_1057285 [Mycena floridula]